MLSRAVSQLSVVSKTSVTLENVLLDFSAAKNVQMGTFQIFPKHFHDLISLCHMKQVTNQANHMKFVFIDELQMFSDNLSRTNF